jgi:iron donor protein CyaY
VEEKEYRSLVADAFSRIEKAFETVDPDIAECENASGAISITLSGGSRIVVSPQPHVRQIWLAVASQGKAYHFDFSVESKNWLDDKTQNLELFGQITQAVKKATGLSIEMK